MIYNYTVIKNRKDKEIVKDKYENIEIEYFTCNEFLTPNHYFG